MPKSGKDGLVKTIPIKECPLTVNDIRERVEKSKILVLRALEKLVDREEIKRSGGGKRGNPFLYEKVSVLPFSIYTENSKTEMKSEDNPLKTLGLFRSDDFQKNEPSQNGIGEEFLSQKEGVIDPSVRRR